MGRDMIPQQVQRYYPPSPGSSSPQLSCKANLSPFWSLSGLLSRAGSEFIRACNIETDGLHDEHFIHQQLLTRTRCSLADCRRYVDSIPANCDLCPQAYCCYRTGLFFQRRLRDPRDSLRLYKSFPEVNCWQSSTDRWNGSRGIFGLDNSHNSALGHDGS